MKKQHVKLISTIIALLLALSIIGSFFVNIFLFAGASLTSDMEDLKDELESIESQKEQLEDELEELNAQISAAYEKKDAIDKNISLISTEIDVTDELIAELEKNIEIKTNELYDAEKKLDEQFELFKKRVRLMYENGETTYLDVLLQSKNFSELLIRYEAVSQIMEYDQQIIEEFTDTKNEIEDIKDTLEDNKSEQEYQKASLEESKAELEAEEEKSVAIISQLEKDEQNSEKELQEFAALEDAAEAEIANLARQIAAQSSSSGADYVGGTFTWPVPGYTRITSPFGMRTHPTTGVYKLHTGTDISAPSGVTLVAMNSGTVVRSTYSSAYGNYVMIDHGGGYVTLCAHMTSRSVSEGQSVTKGQKIGTVGSTGFSTGPHLHFEIIKNGNYTDPMSHFN